MAETQPPLFDIAVCDELRAALVPIMQRHGEVKCFGVAICWKGNLNDSLIKHAVWIGPDGGQVSTPDGIIGSIHQTLRLLNYQLGRGVNFADALRQDVLMLAATLAEGNQQEAVNKLKALLESADASRMNADALQTPPAGETNGSSKGQGPAGG